MRRLFKIGLLTSIFLFILTGCGVQTIQNLKSPINGKTNKLKEIESSIVFGALEANWDIIKINDSLLQAQYIIGNNKHIIYVNIPFSLKEYKLDYFKSINLKYNKKDNTIHRAYNKLVKSLKNSIDTSIKNKLMYFGEVRREFTNQILSNEHGKRYKVYYHRVNKFNYNKKEVAIIKAKDSYGFLRIGQTKLINEFGMALKNTSGAKTNFIDYIVTKQGKYEIVLGGPDANKNSVRIDTIIFEVKPGHEYLFDYSISDDKLAYWIQDLTKNKRVKFKTNTAFRDKAFFSESKKK